MDSFSEYVATQNLILNFDDMAGPGKNYVLWYDLGTKKFAVLGWDFNLTFSGTASTGPDDSTSMGGGGGGGGGGMGGNILKERFLETDAFDDAYHAAYKKLYQEFCASGYALDTLSSLAAQTKKAGADATGVSTTAKSLESTVTSRTKSLAKNKVITD